MVSDVVLFFVQKRKKTKAELKCMNMGIDDTIKAVINSSMNAVNSSVMTITMPSKKVKSEKKEKKEKKNKVRDKDKVG